MKFVPVLLALAFTAHAAPVEPGKVAVEFLEKVRQRKINLAPGGDTALSPQTVEGKRREIAKRLERMAHELGSDPLEIGEVKLDDNLAAVMVRKVGGFDPARLRVFAVALVRQKGGEWSAAPLPASFENSGAGYAAGLRQRLEQLENWMLHEQVEDLESLREQSAGRMRKRIETSLPAAQLRGYGAKEVGEQFLAACGRRDLPAVLGFLGGLAAEMPADWTQRLKAAEQALATGRDPDRPWRLLVSPQVAKVMVDQVDEAASGEITYACLDPRSSNGAPARIEVVHLDLSKSADGLWQIDPPPAFLDPREDENKGDPQDQGASVFPAKWAEGHPAIPQPTAESAGEELTRILHGGDLASLLGLSRLDGPSTDALKTCTQAAAVWWLLHDPAAVRYALPLAFKADGSEAVALYQVFSARDPDRLDLKSFRFEKTDAGWLWTAAGGAMSDELKTWMAAEAKRWPDQWQAKLLDAVPVAADLAKLPAPADDEARACVQRWLDAASRGDVGGALPLFARLAGPQNGVGAFQNLGYEINGSRVWDAPPAITGVYRGKTWTAVGVRIAQKNGKFIRPLYPVVQTDQGPRIMAEIGLFLPENRGQDFLNGEALKVLRKSSSDAVTDELTSLLDAYKAAEKKPEPGK